MKTWPVIGFSLLLNAILAAAIILSIKTTAPPAPATPVAAVPAFSPIPSAPPAESSPSAGLPFQWNRISSDNLKIYRDNLRAIGCPELTVREIIRAVINENFGSRRRDILDSFQDKYWDRVLHGEQVRRQWLPRTEWGLALTSLAAERQQQISDVLGPDALTTGPGGRRRRRTGSKNYHGCRRSSAPSWWRSRKNTSNNWRNGPPPLARARTGRPRPRTKTPVRNCNRSLRTRSNNY
jgi:hypothetical protein